MGRGRITVKLRKTQEWLLNLISAAGGIPADTTKERLEQACQSDIEERAIKALDPFNRKSAKKILCIEVGAAHDVIRPSIYHVLHALGYEIDTILYGKSPDAHWDFFSSTPYRQRRELTVDEYELLLLLNSSITCEYDFVFFNTNFVYTRGRFDSGYDYVQLMDFLRIPIKSKYGCLTIAPHPQGYKNWSLHTSWFSHLGAHGAGMLSCDYFGDNERANEGKDNLFLVSGNVNPSQKNHSMVFDAARELVGKGVSNFKILINGDGLLNVPEDLKDVLVFLNENKPPELFSILRRTKFIISGFDSSVEWQRESYGRGTCSAAFMYSLGFLKPYVVERYFTEAFRLTDDTAIIYEHGMLAEAMEKAIHMSDKEYNDMRCRIKTERDRRRDLSVQAVSEAIEKQKRIRLQPLLFLKTRILFVLKLVKYSKSALTHRLADRRKQN